MNQTPVLPPGASLIDQELESVYIKVQDVKELPKPSARFKKNEPLESLAKSMLKHRIKSLYESLLRNL